MLKKIVNSIFVYCLMLVFALPHIHANASIGRGPAFGQLEPQKAGVDSGMELDEFKESISTDEDIDFDKFKVQFHNFIESVRKKNKSKRLGMIRGFIDNAYNAAQRTVEDFNNGNATQEEVRAALDLENSMKYLELSLVGGIDPETNEVYENTYQKLVDSGSEEPVIEFLQIYQTQTETMSQFLGIGFDLWIIIGLFGLWVWIGGWLLLAILAFFIIKNIGKVMSHFSKNIERGVRGIERGITG